MKSYMNFHAQEFFFFSSLPHSSPFLEGLLCMHVQFISFSFLIVFARKMGNYKLSALPDL